jgi:hypothetical protein
MSRPKAPPQPTRCIFCDSELGPFTKPEHILLNALGGRKTSRGLVCDRHNGEFGSSIDKALTDQLSIVRNMLQLESGSGKPPPMLRRVQAGQEVFNVRQDGKFEQVAQPFALTKRADGETILQVNARSPEHLAELVPHIAAKLKTAEEKVRELLKTGEGTMVWKRPDPICHDVVFGGPVAVRSMVKACLELWATVAGNEDVRSPAYAAARHFVLVGDDQFLHDRTSQDYRYVPGADQLTARFGDFFNLIYVRSDPEGRVVAHFTLYNMMGWQIILADGGGRPNLKVGLISNPLKPSDWSETIADDIEIDSSWLEAPEIDDDHARFQTRVVAMIERHQKQATIDSMEQIASAELKRHGIADIFNEPDEARRKAAISSISSRWAMHLVNVPHTYRLSPDEIDAMLNEVGSSKD